MLCPAVDTAAALLVITRSCGLSQESLRDGCFKAQLLTTDPGRNIWDSRRLQLNFILQESYLKSFDLKSGLVLCVGIVMTALRPFLRWAARCRDL